jgi:tRNA-dihydrouridine synthase
MEIELKGERVAINEMRKSIAYYIKGDNKAAEFRAKINTLNSKEEIFEELDKFFKEL